MERFIASSITCTVVLFFNLKSSMERFIVNVVIDIIKYSIFKIQYGEIYRKNIWKSMKAQNIFKIQYGEIYSLSLHDYLSLYQWFKIQYGEIYSMKVQKAKLRNTHLKSSMERFIAALYIDNNNVQLFKIQYGEIYRWRNKKYRLWSM